MIRFTYTIGSMESFVETFAREIGVPVHNHQLRFPPEYANGYIKSINLPNGISMLLIDFTLHTELYFRRSGSPDQDFFVFCCEEYKIPDQVEFSVGQGIPPSKMTARSALYMVSSLSDFEVHARAGTELRGVRMQIPSTLLKHYFKLGADEDVLSRYLTLRNQSLMLKEVDFESRLIMEELLAEGAAGGLFYESRSLRLLENFFAWLYKQWSHDGNTASKLSRSEIDLMVQVEKDLLEDLALAPFIEDLARKHALSSARLKKLFKEVHGLSIYQHFQKNRMQKAREILFEKKMPIKEVALELGYENASNFSTAFKKQFGILPGKLL
jgi:AraC-like DNA-binding protein